MIFLTDPLPQTHIPAHPPTPTPTQTHTYIVAYTQHTRTTRRLEQHAIRGKVCCYADTLVQFFPTNFSLSFPVKLGGDSQNFLHIFLRFFVALGLKILRLFRLKVLFEADIIKG